MRQFGLTALLASAALMAFVSAPFAQSRSWQGGVMPMDFDGNGERHYHVYGYYGPLVPPIASEDQTSVNAHLASERSNHHARDSSHRPRAVVADVEHMVRINSVTSK